MAMEELDEFEVLWPETCCHTSEPPPRASPAPVQPSSEAPAAARSRPVDVPNPKAARARRWDGPRDDGDRRDDDRGGGKANIVPPHLLVSGRRRSETAWTLRASSGPPPCKQARDLRQLRTSVLRMTGFIEG
ncbi:uncharacterized protein LOC120701279 [Panicum virgatum]|uniref:Uncharacterized protein n=1 Tax=Panicum virgatum TaxID=38727 RepID=A0A8T0UZS9_PANVG|nr:uncharacterized protein LOC120701279 [Panicum virgatum]KAG2626203.1 hypothetical protein PVAP13_3KG328600 [Panicum virgatum]